MSTFKQFLEAKSGDIEMNIARNPLAGMTPKGWSVSRFVNKLFPHSIDGSPPSQVQGNKIITPNHIIEIKNGLGILVYDQKGRFIKGFPSAKTEDDLYNLEEKLRTILTS